MVALSIRSGIPVQTWLDGDPHDLETALHLITQDREES